MAQTENLPGAEVFETLARLELPRLLEAWSGLPVVTLRWEALSEREEVGAAADPVLNWAGHRLRVQVKAGARAAQVDNALRQLRARAVSGGNAGSLLVVPHMGEVGERMCERAGVSWVDLSGNAEIRLDTIRIHRRGQPNRFSIHDAKTNPFSPKASRISRLLLEDPRRWWKQEELIAPSGLSRGYVSRVASELESLDLVVRDKIYSLRPRDPDLLLDSWKEVYSPRRGSRIDGHVPARSGGALAERVASNFAGQDHGYALTALAAAWRHAPMARFRKVHVYVRGRPGDETLEQLGFRAEERGANVQLIVNVDEPLWRGVVDVKGARCVSALQTYLDLKEAGERSHDAARHLRRQCLNWRIR